MIVWPGLYIDAISSEQYEIELLVSFSGSILQYLLCPGQYIAVVYGSILYYIPASSCSVRQLVCPRLVAVVYGSILQYVPASSRGVWQYTIWYVPASSRVVNCSMSRLVAVVYGSIVQQPWCTVVYYSSRGVRQYTIVCPGQQLWCTVVHYGNRGVRQYTIVAMVYDSILQ